MNALGSIAGTLGSVLKISELQLLHQRLPFPLIRINFTLGSLYYLLPQSL